MSKDPKTPAPETPTPIKVDVINPRYEGGFEMVVKAMLQRPRKRPDPDEDESTDDGAHSPT